MGSNITNHNTLFAEDDDWALAQALDMNPAECEAWSKLAALVESFLSIEAVSHEDNLPTPLRVHLAALRNHLMSLPVHRRAERLVASHQFHPYRRNVR